MRTYPKLVADVLARVRAGESLYEALAWVWFRCASQADRDGVDGWLVEQKHRLGYMAGTPYDRCRLLCQEAAGVDKPRRPASVMRQLSKVA
jgi:hypothetical protein